jgi:hypothetical protein
MLSKEEFIDIIHEEVVKAVGDLYTIERMVVSKNNGTEKIGLVFKRQIGDNSNVAPVFLYRGLLHRLYQWSFGERHCEGRFGRT